MVFATLFLTVLKPNKTSKVRRVCNAASKYKELYLNEKRLAGTDLLHRLIGKTLRFCEGATALTANYESAGAIVE